MKLRLHYIFFAGLLSLSLSLKSQEAKKNVLVIMVDDFNHWIEPIGYYPDAKTPAINKLASEGVLFRDASSSSPVCHPSRNAMWSGIHPLTSGISSNGGPWIREVEDFDDVVTMNQYFKENGYYTYGGGKLYHPGRMGDEVTDPDNWSAIYEGRTGSPGGADYEVQLAANSAYRWSAGTFNIEDSNDRTLARHFAEQITNYDREEPFFFAMGLFRPHLPWNCHKDFFDLYDPTEISIPQGYMEGDNDDVCQGMANTFEEILQRNLWKEALRAYLANMSYADSNVEIVLDALDASGLRDNTIIVFVGDHGWHIGEKDRMSKHAVFDQASRTTLIIHDPGAQGNGQISSKVVSMQDIYPTLVSLTGLPSCTRVQGNDISQLLTDPNSNSWDQPIFIKYANSPIIKTNEWRFIQDVGDPSCSQLYNIANDPYEWNNLYGNSNYASIVSQLTSQINEQIQEGNEVRQINECIEPEEPVVLGEKKTGMLYFYPNPVKDFMELTYYQKNLILNIYDLGGKKLLSHKGQPRIDVRSLKSGTYIVKIQTGESYRFQKI